MTVCTASTTSGPIPTSMLPRAQSARARHTDDIVERMAASTDAGELFALEQELIATNLEVARSIASRYQNRGIALEDLEQVALMALTASARRFRADSGNAFLSFCVPTIRGEIRRHFRDLGWMVRPPRSLQELQYRVTRAQSELSAANGRLATDRELAAHLDEDLRMVREAMDGQGSFSPASLDRPTGSDEDGSPLGEMLPGEETGPGAVEARVLLTAAVRRLGERDRRILGLRFVDGLTQREIADVIGVTQMQISRLLSRILGRLRAEIGELEEPAGV